MQVAYNSHHFHNWGAESIRGNELIIFKDADFQGDSWTLRLDLNEPNRPYYFQLKGTGFNNEVTSWKLGRNLYADFCDGDLEFQGYEGHPVFTCPDTGLEMGSAVGTAAMTHFEPDNAMSGVILYYYDPLVKPAATVYSGTDCTGRSAALFTDGVESSAPRRYGVAELQAAGIDANQVSSIMAPVGTHLHVFEQGFEQGEEFRDEEFDGQEDKDGWMVCQNLVADWQNTIVSISVEYRQPQPVRGKWMLMGSGDHSCSYFSGFFTREVDIPLTVMQGNLLAQFEVGLEYQNRHCSTTQLVTEGIREATYDLMMAAFDAPEVELAGCPPRHPLTGKSGYWVFVVETQDGDATIISSRGVCRYGEDWDVAPLCPPAACVDADCTECLDWY